MTTQVTFTLLPVDRLEAACAAAQSGTLPTFLKTEGKTAAQFAGDGAIFGPVFAYLDEVHGINVTSSEYDDVAARLGEATGDSHHVLTATHRAEHEAALDPAHFDRVELQDFHDDYNGAPTPGAGTAMASALRALRESLARLDATRVTLLRLA